LPMPRRGRSESCYYRTLSKREENAHAKKNTTVSRKESARIGGREAQGSDVKGGQERGAKKADLQIVADKGEFRKYTGPLVKKTVKDVEPGDLSSVRPEKEWKGEGDIKDSNFSRLGENSIGGAERWGKVKFGGQHGRWGDEPRKVRKTPWGKKKIKVEK